MLSFLVRTSNVDGVDVGRRIGRCFVRHKAVRNSPINGENQLKWSTVDVPRQSMIISQYDGGLVLECRRNKARLVADSRCTVKWSKRHPVYRLLTNALYVSHPGKNVNSRGMQIPPEKKMCKSC